MKKIKKIIKYIKNSKTLIFNFVLGVSGAIEAYSGFLRGLFNNDQAFGVFMVVVASIGSYLRFVTTKPLGEKIEEGDA